MDTQASQLLGSSIACGSPFSTMSSSSSINGVTQKMMNLQMPVQGSSASGTVAVRATTSNGALTIESCMVSVGGRQITIDPTGTSSGGGSSSGDRGGSGSNGVIDVDVIDV